MIDIIIDDYNFTELDVQKYWTFPKSYDVKKKREESKYMCVSGSFCGSVKHDGFFSIILKDKDGNYHLRSRTESTNGGYADKADWIPHITEELSWLPNESVLLGEIYFPNNEGSRKVTTVLNCLKDKCLERQKKNGYLHFYIFDVIAYDGKNIMNTCIEDRINNYLNKFNEVDNCNYIERAEYKEGQELWDLYINTINAGGEGIVITKKDAKYCPGKRTARMTLKLKKELTETIDAVVTGKCKPATRAYNGKLIENWTYWENIRTGEISFENQFESYTNGGPWEPVSKAYAHGWASSIEIGVYKDNVLVPIGYISGITEEVKSGITEPDNKFVNAVVSINAMEVECIQGQYSLRHGKIMEWRNDKAATDCTFDQIANN